MQCLQCGRPNPSLARFCVECGGALGTGCPHCGTPVVVNARFCHQCGLAVAPAPAGHEAGARALSAAALEGERKHVTVLFADLKGSLALLADRDPEDAREILDPVLDRLMEAVHYYEGTVNQVLGDGIMAIFGAPVSHEDHAVRACYAALRMQETIRRLAATVAAQRGADVSVRVGINSGEVVVRAIGSDLQMDYSAVGETTHLAARVEQLAAPGTIFLTASTARLTAGLFDIRAAGPAPIKGLSEPAEIFELTAARRGQTRLESAAVHGLTTFVGRTAEMAELLRALEDRAERGGQVVAVVGEAGVGKSRLLREFAPLARGAGWAVLEVAAPTYGRSVAWLPVVELLRRYFGIAESDGPAAVRARIAARLSPGEHAHFASALAALLDVPVEDRQWTDLDAEQRRRRTIDALKHLVVQGSRARPLCLIVEDLQWADAESHAALDSIVQVLPGARVVLVVSHRPGHRHDWAAHTWYRELRVDAFSGANAGALLAALLGGDPSLAATKAALLARTEGNAFFLEESVRHLADTGALVGRPGRYRLGRELADPPLPETVHAVVAARIDSLDPEDKRVLQAAAAVGRDVPLPLLEAVAEGRPREFEQSLKRLRAGEFLYEARLFPHIEYVFKHALVLDVAYGSLVRSRRRALDARIVAALEAMFPSRPAEQLDRLAHHAVRGQLWDKAYLYSREAGGKAFARSAHRVAVAHFENALAALEHVVATPQTAAEAIDVRLELRYALSPLGDSRRILDVLTGAERAALELADDHRLALISAFLANAFTLRGDFARAIAHGERALATAERTGDVAPRVIAHAYLALAHWGRGDYRTAADLAGRTVELLRGEPEHERFGMALPPAVYARMVLAWSLAELGECVAAQQAGVDAVAIAEKSGHPHSLASACLGAGVALLRCAEAARAVTFLERARDVAVSAELSAVGLEVAASLASAYVAAGRGADAMALLEDAIPTAMRLRHQLGHWLRTGGMAEALVATGRAQEALEAARSFVDICRLMKARGSEAHALCLVGDAAAALAPADREAALAAYEQALQLAETLEMRPLARRCRDRLAPLRP